MQLKPNNFPPSTLGRSNIIPQKHAYLGTGDGASVDINEDRME